jgi:enamine deaminase RidA (YjgF/YER057c/UK114 family)
MEIREVSGILPEDRKKVEGGKYGKTMGFSKAIRVGRFVYVAGCNAFDKNGQLIPSIDSYEQARKAIENVENALKSLGASTKDVVRTRVYVGPATDWRAVGKAHGEVFGEIMPASTFLFTNFFSDPRLMVEVEADAILDE